MTAKQRQRFHVIHLVTDGLLTLRTAASTLGMSERQVKRLKAAMQLEGAAGLLHHNRGRAPANRLTPALADQITTLARNDYVLCNDTHCTELLAAEHGIAVSRATGRRPG